MAFADARHTLAGVRRSTLWSLLLIPGGLSLGHAIGYWATHQTGHQPSLPGTHSHIDMLAAAAVPFALPVLIRAFVSGRRRELAPARFGPLAVQLVSLYVVAEVVEHLARGVDVTTTLTEASLILGVLAQVAVAAVFGVGIRTVVAVGRVARPKRSARVTTLAALVLGQPPRSIAPSCLVYSPVTSRGPPLLLSA